MKNLDRLPPTFLQTLPWRQNNESIWIGTEFLLKRNLDKRLFPAKMDLDQKIRTNGILKEALLSLTSLKNPTYFDLIKLVPQEREFWQETFLTNESLQHLDETQGLVIDDGGQFSALIHGENHLHLYLMTQTSPFPDAWNQLTAIETSLTKFFTFAFDPLFGYLTSDPKTVGTGLIVKAFLHLPALIQGGHLEQLIDSLPEDVLIYGLGNNKEFIADLVVMENRYKLGLNEENIIHILQQSATAIALKEYTAREESKKTPPCDLLDKVGRAHGLVLNSRKLKTEEALKAISLIKLGQELGWIEGPTPDFFVSMFFRLRRAHLLIQEEGSSPNDLDEKRSQLIRSFYKNGRVIFD
jgi:protein arginine kinase